MSTPCLSALLAEMDGLLKAEGALAELVGLARFAEPMNAQLFEAFLPDAEAHFKRSLSESMDHRPVTAGALAAGFLHELTRLGHAPALLKRGLACAKWPPEAHARARSAVAGSGPHAE